MISIPKGTKDVLPLESYKWHEIESTAREVCRLYNVREIRTPVFEHTELFLRSIGEETDVVGKEMYTFTDKGGRSITLKPEGTAPVARSFVENSLAGGTLPLKMFYLTPVFRYERPQAGRLREHHQFGVEMYGGAAPEYDAEVISLAYDFLCKIGLGRVSLRLNSIGCPNCRQRYNEALKGYLAAYSEDLCSNCRERLDRSPLRVLDCKVDSCKKIVQNAPKITDYICDDCRSHMERLREILAVKNIPYTVDTNIVRGLDYYTKTVFEFVTDALGAQGTVCGGGRYDNLVESVGGKPMPCVGFGMGIERLIMLKEAVGAAFTDNEKPQLFLAAQSPQYLPVCSRLADSARAAGISAEVDYTGRSLKAQFKYADKLGASFVGVIGESEANAGTVRIKKLADATEREVPCGQLAEAVKSM